MLLLSTMASSFTGSEIDSAAWLASSAFFESPRAVMILPRTKRADLDLRVGAV